MVSVAEKPHVVMVPYPAQGHVTPMMRLAKLLHSRGFHVTFVNTEFNHRRLILSKGPDSVRGLPDFRFETIPDGMPVQSDEGATQDIPFLCYYTRMTCLAPFKRLLARLDSEDGATPPVSCVISDGVMSFGIRAAQEMGFPDVQFWTASACSFIGYLHYRELIKRGIFPLNEDYLSDGTLETPVDWVPGMPNIRLKDLPSFFQTTDPNDIMFDFLGEEAQSCLKASAIIFNTFQELEKEALEALISKFNYTNFYTIGPLPLLGKHVKDGEAKSLNSSLWKPDSKVFDWLDRQKPGSVIYVNYGSITTMTGQNFQDFALGLADSKQPFLWVVRPDVVKGEEGESSGELPREFLEAVEDRGVMVTWCAQDEVLAHNAVGAFLTHCGWNSNLESISCGVPVICWPFFADQQTNCHYSCEKWGIGMEIDHRVRRDDVAHVVREMMVGEKGKKMRLKVREWKKIAQDVTQVGGESYVNFEEVIKKGLRYRG
ncbi:7-deoxyloganetin glucosyltransferase-like [Salvia splendens]|uniref:7-deoxyloganetin glucosyltransferase-like n=1 Tax=Salvia splendens TaxID=180675 RepID=UPI001C273B82|nr:7-deoxyloganetin glucosyltransferase-like [Salvia splendens]